MWVWVRNVGVGWVCRRGLGVREWVRCARAG